MKLSTNFTLFGLNVKAIQSYLKEQAKDRRGVRVTRRGDLVYIITAYTAFKLPAVLYPDVIQPVTLRECPADGVTIISAQYGFEVEENAPDLVDIFKNHAPNEKPVERTPFLQDIPTGKKKSGLARLFHIGTTPILINTDYDSMVNPVQFTYHARRAAILRSTPSAPVTQRSPLSCSPSSPPQRWKCSAKRCFPNDPQGRRHPAAAGASPAAPPGRALMGPYPDTTE